MPRVTRPAPARIAASADVVRDAAIARFGATSEDEAEDASEGTTDGARQVLEFPDSDDRRPSFAMTITLRGDGDSTLVDVHPHTEVDIPFFAWFFRPMTAVSRRRATTFAVESLRAEATGTPEPEPPKPVIGLPPVAF